MFQFSTAHWCERGIGAASEQAGPEIWPSRTHAQTGQGLAGYRDFESTEEACCCPDFTVTTWALCIDPPFAEIDSGWLVCYSRRHVRAFRGADTRIARLPLSRGFGTDPGNSDPLAR